MNPASKFPTDFGLLSIDESAKDGVIKVIEKLPLVKDMNVDSRYKRSLLREHRPGVETFADGKKRPGKMFTKMSFTEGDEEYRSPISNTSINWKRHLLMQARFFSLLSC